MATPLAYGRLDRLLHRLAFGLPALQSTAADLERALFGRRYRGLESGPPILVCGLPRAGTTLLLELLSRHPDLACQRYRDMPFVLAPLLWSRVSGPFQRAARLAERAHGDGLAIGFDSPEAFEEVFWKTRFPAHYRGGWVPLWSAEDTSPALLEAYGELRRKVLLLRGHGDASRYLAKNNANIARIGLLSHALPDARLVVPLRRPLDQARSLLRQHLSFTRLHREQPFARRYMDDLGHFEFGASHRPFDFPRARALLAGRDPARLDYWLAYWIAAHEEIWRRRAHLTLLPFEAFCAAGAPALAALARRLDLDPAPLAATAPLLRPELPRAADLTAEDADLADQASVLHARLGEAVPQGLRAVLGA
jgi:hypothetical protein